MVIYIYTSKYIFSWTTIIKLNHNCLISSWKDRMYWTSNRVQPWNSLPQAIVGLRQIPLSICRKPKIALFYVLVIHFLYKICIFRFVENCLLNHQLFSPSSHLITPCRKSTHFLVDVWTENSDWTFKKIPVDNHYKTICRPVRREYSSCRV